MSDSEQGQLHYVRYQDFLEADPRRRGDALELGHQWRDGTHRYRVCWYEETGELTIERLDADGSLELEDFHGGVSGPVEVIREVKDRQTLEALLGRWPNIAPGEPRTLSRLRERLAVECGLPATPLRPRHKIQR